MTEGREHRVEAQGARLKAQGGRLTPVVSGQFSVVRGGRHRAESRERERRRAGVRGQGLAAVLLPDLGNFFNWITKRRASFTASSVGKARATSGASKTRFVPSR